MTSLAVAQFRLSRLLGRIVTRLAAAATLGRMPPFVSTSAVVVERGRVLVVMDPIRREPVLPGGHLKWRERPESAATRETREETGYDVEIRRLLAVRGGEQWCGEPGVVRVVYEARVMGGVLRSSPEGEARWLEVDAMLTSGARDAPIVRLWLEQASADGAAPNHVRA